MSRQYFNQVPNRTSRIEPFRVSSNNVYSHNPSRLLSNDFQPNNAHIQNIASHSTQQEMIYYEYEVVDKKKEEEVLQKQIRSKGICLCQRWICMLIGNLVILIFIISLLGLLLYIDSPANVPTQPLTFGQSCTIGSTNCESYASLYCPNGTCVCSSNLVWNTSLADCACPYNQYWDGYEW